MKWLPPNGSTQHTADRRYCIVHATEGNWIAYRLGPTTGKEIGVKKTDEAARKVCETHDNWQASSEKRA